MTQAIKRPLTEPTTAITAITPVALTSADPILVVATLVVEEIAEVATAVGVEGANKTRNDHNLVKVPQEVLKILDWRKPVEDLFLCSTFTPFFDIVVAWQTSPPPSTFSTP